MKSNIVNLYTKKFNLEETSEAKKLNRVLHDIRSPLQTLKILSKGHLDDHPQRNEIEMKCYKQIEKIVSNENVDKNELYPLCIPNFIRSLRDRKEIELEIHIKLHITISRPWINSKLLKEEIEVILSNIINNAHGALNGDGSISIKVKQSGGKTHISVTDDGVGLQRDRLMKIGKLHNSYTLNGQGLGLNNSIRKIHNLGGEIFCRSLPSIGTQFTISLP